MIAAAPRVTPTGRLHSIEPRGLRELAELVAFRTVSADDGAAPAMRACAAWLSRRLARAGFATRTVEADGRPIAVLAERPGPARGSVLVYAHFDVQPVGDAQAWRSPPFRLHLHGGRVRGRGASDNKGPLNATLVAIERLAAARRPIPTIRLWLDGEEEIGSPHRAWLLRRHAPRVRSEVVLVVDSPVGPDGRPRIVSSFRGRIGMEVRLSASDPGRRHAGQAVGVVGDPAARLAHAIATAADLRGRARLMARGGTGERPTLVVTSLAAGEGGLAPSGIPESATATLDVRLPPGAPLRPAVEALRASVARVAATESPVRSTTRLTGAIPGVHIPIDARLEAIARRAIHEAWGVAPSRGPSGGSIAAVASLAGGRQAPVLALGLTGLDDAAHGPNESIALDRLARIEHTVRRILEGLAT